MYTLLIGPGSSLQEGFPFITTIVVYMFPELIMPLGILLFLTKLA